MDCITEVVTQGNLLRDWEGRGDAKQRGYARVRVIWGKAGKEL